MPLFARIAWLLFFVVLRLLTSSSQDVKPALGCDSGCGTCVDSVCKKCDPRFFLANGTCAPCSANCLNCINETNCTACKHGYWAKTHLSIGYWTRFKEDEVYCFKCEPKCTACWNPMMCTECVSGYYGSNCHIDCIQCEGGACSSSRCTFGCAKGYFEYEYYHTCGKCMPTCTACANWSSCTECPVGYYGKTCENDCNLCKGGSCSIEGCTFGCKEGYYEKNGTCYK